MQLYEMNSVLSLKKNKEKMFPKVHGSPLAQNPSFKTMKPCIDCTQMRNMADKFTLAPQGNQIMYWPFGTGNVSLWGHQTPRGTYCHLHP